MGYEILISSNENDLENILSRSIEQLEKCAPPDDLPDIIFTDIIGAKVRLKSKKEHKIVISGDLCFLCYKIPVYRLSAWSRTDLLVTVTVSPLHFDTLVWAFPLISTSTSLSPP